MTIRQAIDLLDLEKPNDRTSAEKIRWLSHLDTYAYTDIMLTHTPRPAPFSGYTADTPPDTVLLIGEPFDRIYPLYMTAEIDFLNGDFTRYNNACDYYNRVFLDWANHYHARHLPVTGPCVQLSGR